MTKKHYIAIAAILKAERYAPDTEVVDKIALALAQLMKADNPLFDHARFLTACGLGQDQKVSAIKAVRVS